MKKEEIEEVIELVWRRSFPYTNQFGAPQMRKEAFAERVKEIIAEIQERQKPAAWVYPARYGSLVGFVKPPEPKGPEDWNDDAGEWYCYPLFTFPPAEQKCECKVPGPDT